MINYVEFLLLIGIFFLIFMLFFTFFTVDQQTIAVVERFGRFSRIAEPGLNTKIPFIEQISGTISLRLRQLEVEIETKTNDDVFVKILTCVQFRVLPEKTYEAFYTLDNPEQQIQSFVFDVVRAHVPKIKLDDVFAKKDEIANSVSIELKEVMNAFGYNIIKTLVTDINPDPKVKAAMNEINEAQRLRVAATERGEAEKILKVKQAEAEAQSKILQGEGMAGQRQAIIEGLKNSLSDFQEQIENVNTQDVMSLILMTQYFDMLKDMGTHGKMNTILIPHSPSSLHSLYEQIREAMIIGQKMGETNSN